MVRKILIGFRTSSDNMCRLLKNILAIECHSIMDNIQLIIKLSTDSFINRVLLLAQ